MKISTYMEAGHNFEAFNETSSCKMRLKLNDSVLEWKNTIGSRFRSIPISLSIQRSCWQLKILAVGTRPDISVTVGRVDYGTKSRSVVLVSILVLV